MNTKRFSKILAVALAFVLCFAMAMPAFAADGTNYNGMTGDADSFKTTFDKYLVMDGDVVAVPDVDFTFTIRAGAENKTGTFPVFAGEFNEDNSKPSISNEGKISFTSGSGVFTTAQDGDYVKNLGTGEKYAKGTATIDFTGVTFPEPGVYRYIITESASDEAYITDDASLTRILDVYVEDATVGSTKQLKIAGYVLHATATSLTADEAKFGTAANNAEAGTAASDYKSQGFTNEYITHDLTFSKTVDGNQASRDKYFKFTVTIEGALPETTYNVDITGADAEPLENSATIYEDVENVSSFTTDASGNKTLTFYLQHGQTITIENLPAGATWTITETPEDYKPSAEVDTEDETFGGEAASVDGAEVKDMDGIKADTTVDFTNTREGVIPTGVLLTVAPFAVIMLVGIAGVAFVVLKKKRASAE